MDNSAAQKIIDEALNELECWNLTLCFDDMERLAENEHVNLFTFTDKSLHTRENINPNLRVIFDQKLPPNSKKIIIL